MRKEYVLSDRDYNAIMRWAKTHKCSLRQKDGRPSLSCSGGELTISFTPTAIGDVITVECCCGKKKVIDNL